MVPLSCLIIYLSTQSSKIKLRMWARTNKRRNFGPNLSKSKRWSINITGIIDTPLTSKKIKEVLQSTLTTTRTRIKSIALCCQSFLS